MQKYRLNLKFLAFLLVILVVFGVGVYGLWAWQMGNNAVDLEQRARQLTAEGEIVEALKLYRRYFSIVDQSDPEAREPKLELANLYADLIEDNKVHPSEFMLMLQWIDDTVRDNPEDDKLRRRMVDVAMRIRRWPDAQQHLDILIRRSGDDEDANAELRALQTQCRFAAGEVTEAIEESCELIGFNRTTGTFEGGTPPGGKQPDVYYNLARELHETRPEFAEKIIATMVERNPESYRAFLNRGMFFFRLLDQPGRAEPDLLKAYELNKDDGMVLLQSIDLAITLKDYDRARSIGDEAIEKFPEAHRIYEVMAEVEKQDSANTEAGSAYQRAVAQYNRGLKNNENHPILLLRKAELQIDFKEFDEARKTIETLSKFNVPRQWLDYLAAKELVMRNNWPKARDTLTRIYAEQIQAEREWGWPGHGAKIDQMLALAYEGLNQFDKAIESYEKAKLHSGDPRLNQFADMGITRCRARLGRGGDEGNSSLTKLIQDQFAKPKGQRDWTQVNARLATQGANSGDLPPAREKLQKAAILALEGEFEQAFELGDKALTDEQAARAAGDTEYATLTPLDEDALNQQLSASAFQAIGVLLRANQLKEAMAGLEILRQRVPDSTTLTLLEIEIAQRDPGTRPDDCARIAR